MPGMSRRYAIDHEGNPGKQSPERQGEGARQLAGNAAAQEQMNAQQADEPSGGILHVCAASANADTFSCVIEGGSGGKMHGWIALEEEGEDRKSWGLWPAKQSLKAVAVDDGAVMSPDPYDKKGAPTASQSFHVDHSQIKSLKSWIGSNSNWNYSFGFQNCVHWANAAVASTGNQAAGMNIPLTDTATLMQCPSGAVQNMRAANVEAGVASEGGLHDPYVRGRVEWGHLAHHEVKAWTLLGYNEGNWEMGVPAIENTPWKSLTEEQRKAAGTIGYSEAVWNQE